MDAVLPRPTRRDRRPGALVRRVAAALVTVPALRAPLACALAPPVVPVLQEAA